jgi:hypothetical protein
MKNNDYTEATLYSKVQAIGFLPKKAKYTMRDVNTLMVESLFNDTPNTLLPYMAAFVVKCSAIHHNTDWSKAVGQIPVSII